jgi:hypothetical protein
MSKLWEHMSRDEKLDYIKEQIEAINGSLGVLARHYNDINERLSYLVQKREEK